MTKIVLTPHEFADWVGKLGDRMEQGMRRGVLSGCHRAIPIVQNSGDTAPPASPNGKVGATNTGHYRQSWRAEAVPEGARLFNNAPYAPVIEHGRRPKGVSETGLRNLENWARRKLQLSNSEARSAAFAIARSLAKRPLLARQVMGRVEDEIIDAVMEEVRHELDAEIDRK